MSIAEYVSAVNWPDLGDARYPVLAGQDLSQFDEFDGVVVDAAVAPTPNDPRSERFEGSPKGAASWRAVVTEAERDRARAIEEARGVIAAHTSSFAPVALVYAAATRRRFVMFDTWAALAAQQGFGDRPVTVFAEPACLDTSVTSWLQGHGQPPLLGGRPYGIVTALDLPTLTRLVARMLVYQRLAPRARCLSVVDPDLDADRVAGHEVVPIGEFSAAHARQLRQEHFDVVALSSHGDQIDANLNEAVLCGRPERWEGVPRSHAVGARTHTCIETGECRRNPGGRLVLLPVGAVRCRVLFNETCTGTALSDGVFPRDLALTHRALDGWPAAYAATTKIVCSSGIGPILFQAFVASGLPLGQATALVDQIRQQVSGDVSGYLLVGDAETVVRPDAAELRRERARLTADGSFEVDVLEPEPFVVLVAVEGESATSLADDASVRAEVIGPAPRRPVFAVVVRNLLDVALGVLFVSTGPLPPGRLLARLAPVSARTSAVTEEVRDLGAQLELARFIQGRAERAEGLRDTPALRRLADDLRQVVAGADQVLRRAVRARRSCSNPITQTGCTDPFDEVGAVLDRGLAPLDERLARGWLGWKMTHFAAALYDGLLFATGERHAGACYICGTPAFDFIQESEVQPNLRRVTTHCPHCGVLSDRPPEEPMVRISAPDVATVGSTVRAFLRVGHAGYRAGTTASAIGFEGELPWLSSDVAPDARVSVVAPGQWQDEPFDLEVSPVSSPGVYALVSVTAHHFRLNLSVRPILLQRPPIEERNGWAG